MSQPRQVPGTASAAWQELVTAITAASAALERMRAASDAPALEAMLAATATLLDRLRGDIDAREISERLAAIAATARERGEPRAAAFIVAYQGLAELDAGAVATGQARAEKAIAELAGLSCAAPALHMADRLVRGLRRLDAVDAALASGQRLLALTWPPDVLDELGMLRITVGETALLAGQPDRAEPYLQAARAEAEAHDRWKPLFQLHMARAAHAQLEGRASDAEAEADRARALAVSQRDPHRYLAAARFLAGSAEQRGDHRTAYAVTARAVKSLDQLLGPSFAPAGRDLLLALRQRWGDAEYEAIARDFIAQAALTGGRS